LGIQESRFWRFADFAIFAGLLIALAFTIFSQAVANLQADSIDYYSMLQKLAEPEAKPIVSSLHFMQQRLPGYPIAALIPYYFASFFIEPLVQAEELTDFGQGFQTAIPSRPFPLREVFFKNILLPLSDAVLEWKVLFALLFTSYAMLFAGIFYTLKALLLEKTKIAWASLIMVAVFASSVFLQNIILTPAYATLAAFGFSAVFCYFFIKGFLEKSQKAGILAGIALGFLALARPEGFLLFALLAFFLLFYAKKPLGFLKTLLPGIALAFGLLLAYNFLVFGNALHFGFLASDINTFGFDAGFAFKSLFHPESGILFWSPLIVIGIIGLLAFPEKKHLRILGFCSLALILFLLFRIPIMYYCTENTVLSMGGVPVSCFAGEAQKLSLVRSDINRYVSVLLPFAILGLAELARHASKLLAGKNQLKKQKKR